MMFLVLSMVKLKHEECYRTVIVNPTHIVWIEPSPLPQQTCVLHMSSGPHIHVMMTAGEVNKQLRESTS
jgi:hypothetical protein